MMTWHDTGAGHSLGLPQMGSVTSLPHLEAQNSVADSTAPLSALQHPGCWVESQA